MQLVLNVITASTLCGDDFLSRMDIIASARPERIILREKHLSEEEYAALARACLAICRKCGVELVVNSFADTARRLDCGLHIPYAVLERQSSLSEKFELLGVSVHSPAEAAAAQQLGADYLIAGHIYATDCKKGLVPRGTEYLREVAAAVTIPVYAIGGITKERLTEVYSTGAAGVCVMSHFMQCPLSQLYDEVRAFQSRSENARACVDL